MKYKHDRMLPAHAFQVRGSVIGGRGMRLHGDSDFFYGEEAPQDGYYQDNGDSGGFFVPYEKAADPITSPLAAAPPPPPAPVAAPAPLAAPAAPVYTPFNPDQFGFVYSSEEENNYYRAAKLANLHMSRGDPGTAQQFIDQANQLKAHLSQPFRTDTITTGSGGDEGTRTETVFITPNGIQSVVQDEQTGQYFANIIGSGSGEGGESNRQGAAIDIPALAQQKPAAETKPYGTGMGPALGYAYEIKNSYGDVYRRFDAQGNLTEYLDRDLVFRPASGIKPVGTQYNPDTGQLDTVYSFGENNNIVGNSESVPGMSEFREDQGGFIGEGTGVRLAGLALAGLSAGVAGGAFAGSLGLGSAFGSGLAAVNPILTAATQGALIGGAAAGLQGGSYSDMLKSALIGGISAGLTPVIGGADLGTLGTVAAKTGLQTGLTAIAGGDVGKAAITGLINGILPVAFKEILPAETMGAFNSLPDPLKKIIMSTAGNVLNAGFNGQDISDAATSGVVNGMISLGKDYIKGAFNSLSDSELAQTVKGYFDSSPTASNFSFNEEFQELPYDANAALDAVINNLPSSGSSSSNVDYTDPEDVQNRLISAFNDPYSASSLGTLASATTSDQIITLPDGTRQLVVGDDGEGVRIEENSSEGRFSVDDQALTLFNEILQDEGYSDFMATSLDDPRLLDFVNRANERIEASNTMSVSNLDSTAYAIDAFVQAGGDTRAITSDESTQSPQFAVTEAFKAFFNRNPTDIELNTFAPSGAERLAPQEYLKNVFDYAQQEKLQEQQAIFVEFPPLTQIAQETVPVDQVTPDKVESEKVEPQKVEPEKVDKKDTKAGGSGTQGGSLAGDEGRVGAAASLATAAPSESAYGASEEFQALETTQATVVESQSISVEMANLGMIDPADIPVVTANLIQSSNILNVTPTFAVTNGLVTNQGTLSDKGIEKVSSDTGLSTAEVANAVQGSNTIETSTGSGLNSDGTGAAKGADTGVSGDEGLGGRSGEGVGGQGTGVGTGVGAGEGTGSGGGLPSSGGSYGGARITLNPQFPGALPGALEGTYLKGVDVDDYDPFANYNVYQQMQPVQAAQGGSPLQLMQMQQGIVGNDPNSYSNVQFRPMPNYFTYGSKPQQPTTFAGSQLLPKPRPNIPVTPTGKIGNADFLYSSAGSNQLSPAGAALPPLASGMMARGGQAQQNDMDEHIPEFITGATGHYVRGRGDGQSDDIPAMLADGEYVFDSSVVSTLGNGSSDAGAKLLDAFRETLRDHTRSAPKDKIPPKASPLQYMQEAMKKVGMA